MVFNATFNNISVILWLSILFVEETWVTGELHRPVADKLYLILYWVHLAMSGIGTYNFAWIKEIWQKHIYIWELKK